MGTNLITSPRRTGRGAARFCPLPGPLLKRTIVVFSSIAFLGLFLPLTFAAYYLTPVARRNLALALASLIFYAWGEPRFLILMCLSIGINYRFAIAIETALHRKRTIGIAIAINLLLLGAFKYAGFAVENFNALRSLAGLEAVVLKPLPLPIGISFYTFHAISYLVDIYRRNAKPSRNIVDYCLYITLFPQLIAGPIIRYKDIQAQIKARIASLDDISAGILRFTMGLAKKVLIANQLGVVADTGFSVPDGQLSTSVAWLSLVCYALQIYFDFSGYSDMAIGLARMFGFRFPENFNYPYLATSIQDFWRRWHISLSTWFRDYVYIPLGGNRLGATRTLLNLWIVFVLTGIWHGAAWNFILWGAAHGAFLTMERIFAGKGGMTPLQKPLSHVYTTAAILFTWVLFRADTLEHAGHFYRALCGLGTNSADVTFASLYSLQLGLTLLVAVTLAVGAYPRLCAWLMPIFTALRIRQLDGYATALCVAPLLILSLMSIALGQYNPFIYFRF